MRFLFYLKNAKNIPFASITVIYDLLMAAVIILMPTKSNQM
jgi:hypothetical protein